MPVAAHAHFFGEIEELGIGIAVSRPRKPR